MNFIAWGAGLAAKKALKYINTDRPNDRVVAFYDNNKELWGKEVDGIPVKSPDTFIKDFHSGDYDILLSTQFFEQIVPDILKQHGEWMKDSGKTVAKDPLNHLYCFMQRTSFLDHDYPYSHDLEQIYADDCINKCYIDLIRRGFMRKNMILPYSDVRCLGDTSYFDVLLGDDVSGIDITYLDLGACDGGSIFQVMDVLGDTVKEILAIEPSPNDMKEMVKNISEHQELQAIVKPMQCAIGECRRRARFSGVREYFKEDETGEIEIEIKPLDDIAHEVTYHPFLKMDVEGGELNVLKGGANFIRTKKPLMAICVYHLKNDFYTIPDYIRSISPDYKFYLRGGNHLVCYAVPDDLVYLVARAS